MISPEGARTSAKFARKGRAHARMEFSIPFHRELEQFQWKFHSIPFQFSTWNRTLVYRPQADMPSSLD
jgi:hypothetical protein